MQNSYFVYVAVKRLSSKNAKNGAKNRIFVQM